MQSRDQFRQELRAQIGEAIKRGDPNLVMAADELYRTVGWYAGPRHRMQYCCEVMREEMKPGDRIVTQGSGEKPDDLLSASTPNAVRLILDEGEPLGSGLLMIASREDFSDSHPLHVDAGYRLNSFLATFGR